MQAIKDRTVIDYQIPAAAITLEPDADIAGSIETLNAAPALVLDFSDYLEGRPYSLSKQLRDRFDYKGDLVALGARKDNISMIERCGVNIISAHEKYKAEELLPFFEEITDHYQPNY